MCMHFQKSCATLSHPAFAPLSCIRALQLVCAYTCMGIYGSSVGPAFGVYIFNS